MLDNLYLRLFQVNRMTIPAGEWNTPNVQSAFWRFYYNVEPGAYIDLPDDRYFLDGGLFHFIPAGVRFSCGNTHRIEHFFAHFDAVGLPGMLQQDLFQSPVSFAPTSAERDEAVSLAAAVECVGEENLAIQCRAKALLYRAFATYLDGLPSDRLHSHPPFTTGGYPILPALDHIESHLADLLENPALATLCHMSEAHFIRLFRAQMGKPPGQYIRERRITIAAQRLLFTEDTLDQIAESVGIGDRYYLSRIFKRQIGLAPAAFRRARHV